MNFSFANVYKKNFRLNNTVVLLKGNEFVLIDDAVKKLSALWLSRHETGTQVETLSASEANAAQISDALFSLSFFSQKRIIIMKNLEDIAFEAKTVLLKYLDSPSPDILLLLTLLEDDPSYRKDRKTNQKKRESLSEIIKKITSNGDGVDCSLRGRAAIQEWVTEEASKYGKKLSPSALLYFIEHLGNHASRVPGELKKLSIYCGERNIITEDDIDALVVPHFEATTFMLIDAVCAGKTKHALDLVARLLDQKIKPTEIIFWLSRQFKLLLQAKLLSEKGLRLPVEHGDETGDIAAFLPEKDNLLKIAPFAQGKVFAAEKNLTREDIENALFNLHGVDLSVKGSGAPMDETTAIELLIIRLSERKSKNGKKYATTD